MRNAELDELQAGIKILGQKKKILGQIPTTSDMQMIPL